MLPLITAPENIFTLISLRESMFALISVREHIFHEKTKCVSNDRSRHDDPFCPKIDKIGAILEHFWPLQSLGHQTAVTRYAEKSTS